MKILRNIERCLYSERYPTESKKLTLWAHTAFMNFIQKPMLSAKERPTGEDFRRAWQTFFDVIDVLKPNYCLFGGVSASNYEQTYLALAESSGFIASKIKWSETIGSSAFGRTATIHKGNSSTRLIFIKHPSSFFSWQKWNSYLSTQMSEFMQSLQGNPASSFQ